MNDAFGHINSECGYQGSEFYNIPIGYLVVRGWTATGSQLTAMIGLFNYVNMKLMHIL